MMECKYTPNGREYPNFNCYGFVKYMYKKEHGIDIVDFIGTDEDANKNEEFYFKELNNPKWKEVKKQKGVIVALLTHGVVQHCGYMISDTEFVHIVKKAGVCRVKVTSPKWKHRIEGYYKYA